MTQPVSGFQTGEPMSKKIEKMEIIEEVDTQPGIEDGALDQLLSEEEIRQQMNAIIRRMPAQQKRVIDAFEKMSERYSRTWIGISLLDPTYLATEEAQGMLAKFAEQIANKKSKALTIPDKTALLTVDIGEPYTEHEIAKLIVDLDQQHYQRLNKQLQWYMNLKTFTGPTEPLGGPGARAVEQIYRGLDVVTPHPMNLGHQEFDTPFEHEHTPEEVAEAVKDGVIELHELELMEETANPFLEKVTELLSEAALEDQEGVPIHEPEILPINEDERTVDAGNDQEGVPLSDEPSPEPHWIDELQAEALKSMPQDPNDPKTPAPAGAVTLDDIYGNKAGYKEFIAERDAKRDAKKPTPVADAIARIGKEAIKSNLKEIMEDPEALRKADDEVFGPRDDEHDPTYIDPEKVVDWTKKL